MDLFCFHGTLGLSRSDAETVKRPGDFCPASLDLPVEDSRRNELERR